MKYEEKYKLKAGIKVRCIENNGRRDIEVGKIYQVLDLAEDSPYCIFLAGFGATNLARIEIVRSQYINSIMKLCR